MSVGDLGDFFASKTYSTPLIIISENENPEIKMTLLSYFLIVRAKESPQLSNLKQCKNSISKRKTYQKGIKLEVEKWLDRTEQKNHQELILLVNYLSI